MGWTPSSLLREVARAPRQGCYLAPMPGLHSSSRQVPLLRGKHHLHPHPPREGADANTGTTCRILSWKAWNYFLQLVLASDHPYFEERTQVSHRYVRHLLHKLCSKNLQFDIVQQHLVNNLQFEPCSLAKIHANDYNIYIRSIRNIFIRMNNK